MAASVSTTSTTSFLHPIANGLASSKYAPASNPATASLPPRPLSGLAASKWASSAPARPRKAPKATFPLPPACNSSSSFPCSPIGLSSSKDKPSSCSAPVPPTISPDLPSGGMSTSRWAPKQTHASTPVASSKITRASTCASPLPPAPAAKSPETTSCSSSLPRAMATGLSSSKYAPPCSSVAVPATASPSLPFGGMAASRWAH